MYLLLRIMNEEKEYVNVDLLTWNSNIVSTIRLDNKNITFSPNKCLKISIKFLFHF